MTEKFVLKRVKWPCPECGSWLLDAGNIETLHAHMNAHLVGSHPTTWILRSIR